MNNTIPIKQKKSELLEYLITIGIAAIITSCFLTFVARPVCVNGNSMFPTYKNGQILLIEEVSHEYSRFDVVTLKTNNRTYIKRVIGCPGETIQIKDGQVYIDGKIIDDVIDVNIENSGIAKDPIRLDSHSYFVMGDNRNNSLDSRYQELGPIHKDDIFGKVLFTIIK